MLVDPVLIFDNDWPLEVFGDHYLDPGPPISQPAFQSATAPSEHPN